MLRKYFAIFPETIHYPRKFILKRQNQDIRKCRYRLDEQETTELNQPQALQFG